MPTNYSRQSGNRVPLQVCKKCRVGQLKTRGLDENRDNPPPPRDTIERSNCLILTNLQEGKESAIEDEPSF